MSLVRSECSLESVCEENLVESRKVCLDQLDSLLRGTLGPYVLALSSGWGSGKTFFLKTLQKRLDGKGAHCVYFNAWETDFSGKPLISLVGTVQDTVPCAQLEDVFNDFVETAGKLFAKTPQLVKTVLTSAIKKRLGDDIDSEISAVFSEYANAVLKDFSKKTEERKCFVEKFRAVAAASRQYSLSKFGGSGAGGKGYPLVVLVDELDRCHPDYALQLLEDIKHLFLVENVVFVLAIDQIQLQRLVSHRYGLTDSGGMAQQYLRKFVDMFYLLPDPDVVSFTFEALVSAKIPLPSGFKVENFVAGSKVPSPLVGSPFAIDNSYFSILSHVAYGSVRPLREAQQVVDCFAVISRSYSMSWMESVLVFQALWSQVDLSKPVVVDDRIRASEKQNTPFHDFGSLLNLGPRVYGDILAFAERGFCSRWQFDDPATNASYNFLMSCFDLTSRDPDYLRSSVAGKLRFLERFSD